jgi:hypothetical protein
MTQRFTSLFLALETLKGFYANRRGLKWIVQAKRFEKGVKPVLKWAVELTSVAASERAAIEEKLVELNRPDFRRVLLAMASEYGVTWEDLYPNDPSNQDPLSDFISVRQRLLHGASVIRDGRIAMEIERLQIFLDRLLLRMLDWPQVEWAEPTYVELLKRQWEF